MKTTEKAPDLQVNVITGLSGAGKSQTIHFFEDAGFFCVDNLPPTLLPKFLELCRNTHGQVSRIAVVIDVRGGSFFQSIFDTVDQMREEGIFCRILFLEATDEVLVRRFSETRRKHPLSQGGAVLEDIRFERSALEALRAKADFLINTSDMKSRELYQEIRKIIEH